MIPSLLDSGSQVTLICQSFFEQEILPHIKPADGEKVSSQKVSAQVKIEVMQRAMATCPKINMGCGRKVIPSLLDSGSQVTLICQSFFEQEILPHIKPADGEKANAHQLFQLTAANNGKLPVSMYVVARFEYKCKYI